MKIIVSQPKPRNPLVPLARFRRAGSHRPDGRARRRQASLALKHELKQMNLSP